MAATTAKAGFSTAQKLILGGAAGVGIGYGAYYTTQMRTVGKLEKDRTDIVKLIETEKKRLVTNARLATEAEGRIGELTKQSETASKALKEVEVNLDAARKQVAALEAQQGEKRRALEKLHADIRASQSKLTELKAEAERTKESVSGCEKSLQVATEKLGESKQLLNPLNHPKVKKLLGKN